MVMETYALYLTSLMLFNAALFYPRYEHLEQDEAKEEIVTPSIDESRKQEARTFKRSYFTVYALAVLGDWLQGPYIYNVYKDEKGLDDSAVSALFTVGFVSAGVTASFVGLLADSHGRRFACLTFCVAYSLSCLSVLSNDWTVLLIGRALGGLSSTLLSSMFETWMIAEHHLRHLGNCFGLSEMFSSSVTLSSVVAIIAGIIGEAVAWYSGTKTTPFLVAIVCFGLAFMQIKNWNENYGDPGPIKNPETSSAIRIVWQNPRILVLALTTTIFEGSMYIWVCFWAPTLKATRSTFDVAEPLPFGLIFSCFMCCTMIGSTLFASTELRSDRDVVRLLLGVIGIAANALLIPVLARSEFATFWSFSLFETCIGLYFPTMSRLKNDLIDDAVRGSIYSLIRLPLNAFVVVALGLASRGESQREITFLAIGALLLGVFFVVQRLLLWKI